MSPKTVIIITGPTASGKTDLAIEAAGHFHTSIISADSRQCFLELNAGVSKPDIEQLKLVKHFFINSHSIFDEVNAAIFESLALQWCEEIFSTRDTVIICGGTGLYISAFREGLDEIPAIDKGIRKKIIENYNDRGLSWLRESLKQSDRFFYASGEMANPQRMIRALEVFQSTGRSILSFRNQQKKQRPFRILEFAILLPRSELYKRINERVDKMMESGLLAETVSLLPYQHLNALQTVGYTELFDHLNGHISLEEAISSIKQNTRHYSKRQVTWLNKNKNLIWLEQEYLKRILEVYLSPKT
ncbi:MAG TPA: tRNA (adenosine(37)-N6)-dimethylallyltransferase MiaA [Puia sp.]|jgi:tRNA dimethylallyltransferase